MSLRATPYDGELHPAPPSPESPAPPARPKKWPLMLGNCTRKAGAAHVDIKLTLGMRNRL